jgi:methionyl-tRNA formyltransferase
MTLGAETLISALPAIAARTVKSIKQDDADACYASKLNKAEARVNWSQSAIEIERLIRAFNAWPVAYCEYDKRGRPSKLRLWQAEVVSERIPAAGADPGKVIAESAAGIDVLTGAGVLRITELQAEGKRRMSTADFLNANSLLDQMLK